MTAAISIIIPVKNAAIWLDECLHSITEQTFADWECILINDHSDDNSLKVASVHSFFDHRFRVIPNQGSGLIDAYRTGLANARGEFVARMDADDIMVPQRLEWMHAAIQSSSPKTIVTGKVRFFPEEAIGIGTKFYEDWLNARMDNGDHWNWIWRECVVPSPCWMARKEELQQIGRFEDLEYPEDYNLAFRFFEYGFQVISIPQICHYWRQHGARYSRTSENYSAEKFMAMKWHFFQKLELPKFEKLYLLGTTDKAKILKQLLDEKQVTFTWLSHETNVAGNIYKGKEISLLFDMVFQPGSAIISTLSSIDNHDAIYESVNTSAVQVYASADTRVTQLLHP